MAKNKGGRPSSMTEIVVKKLEEAFSLGCSDEEACLYAGITRTTLWNYSKNNKEFIDRKALLKKNPVLLARKSVVESFEEHPELAWKYLERVDAELNPKMTHRVTGPNDAKLSFDVEVIKGLISKPIKEQEDLVAEYEQEESDED